MEASKPGKQRCALPAEIAAELRVSLARFYELARQRRIGGVVKVGRQVRVDRDQFEEWLRQGGEGLAAGWKHEASEQESS